MNRGEKRTTLMVVFFVLISFSFCFANGKALVKEYRFTSDTENFSYEDNQEIIESGKKYKAVNTEYKLIEKSGGEKIKKSYENVTEAEIAKDIMQNGKKYILKDKKLRGKQVTHSETHRNMAIKQEFPNEMTWEIDGNPVTGTKGTVQNFASETLDTPFSVKGTFYGEQDCMFYELNGKKISANNAPQFLNYPSELLAYLNLSSNDYRIDNGSWSDDYHLQNGKTVRNAIFSGMKRGTYQTAIYSTTLYDADCVYEQEEDSIYKVKAIVTYEPVGLSSTQKALIVGAAVLILVGVISIMLMILRKRETKEKK